MLQDLYLGETKKTVKVRLGEQAAVKRGDPMNGIAVHAHNTQQVKVKKMDSYYYV